MKVPSKFLLLIIRKWKCYNEPPTNMLLVKIVKKKIVGGHHKTFPITLADLNQQAAE